MPIQRHDVRLACQDLATAALAASGAASQAAACLASKRRVSRLTRLRRSFRIVPDLFPPMAMP
ncbi:MAG: hypothetical protein ACOYNP_12410 [Gemmataceae bacterium]